MLDAIGAVLPLALGVAISPIPVIAAILMLLSPRARITSVAFLLGWIVGIAAAVTVFTLLSGVLPAQDPDVSRPVRGVIQLALGSAGVLLAVRQWRSRPAPGADAEMPKWMQAIDSAGFGLAIGLGLLLSAGNPKNLLLSISAGVDIGAADLSVGGSVVVIAIFTTIAASTVLFPVVGYLVAAERLRRPLDALRAWLTRENAVIMSVLMLVLGVSMIGKGVGSF